MAPPEAATRTLLTGQLEDLFNERSLARPYGPQHNPYAEAQS